MRSLSFGGPQANERLRSRDRGDAPRSRGPLSSSWAVVLLALGACSGQLDGGAGNAGGGAVVFEAAPATLHRLTRAEHLASLDALFVSESGVSWTLPTASDALPPDDDSNGFSTIAGSLVSISPLEVETYERAAEGMMAQAIDPARRLAFFGCDVASEGEACARAFIARFGRLAWRRSLQPAEVDALAVLFDALSTRFSDRWIGLGYVLSAILQAPDFLFRVEVGEPDPEEPGRLRYTSLEMASRLSFLVWGGPPDAELLAAGEAGELLDDTEIRAQVERMLEDDRARASLERFFGEFFSLDRLELAQKDPVLFPEWGPEFRASARTEVMSIVGDVITRDDDVRTLLSTDVTFIDTRLATFYGLPDPGPGRLLRTRVPSSDRRGGILGRPAILSMWSHADVTSPTRLGKFVLINLRCEGIEDPPPGQSLEIPTSEEVMTLRQRLERLHEANPSCNTCHSRVDPMGFPFEGFDPIGHVRTTDNGLPVDTEVELDGTTIADAAELGSFLAQSPRVGRCFARRFQRYALAHRESEAERIGFVDVERAFADEGYRMQALLLEVALSPAFRTASPPLGDCRAGERRACEAGCGGGTQTCTALGAWGECAAPGSSTETCNGRDDDCDGATDEMLARSCSSACGEGSEVCSAGSYGLCTARTPGTEGCNHVDDDCDGRTDEGFGTRGYDAPFATLAAFDPRCDGMTERFGTYCNVAFHGFCAMGEGRCGTSGFGPVESGASSGQAICVNAEVIVSSWAELATFHDTCTAAAGYSPGCNAAISRFCASRGFPTGYGPVSIAGGVSVACVPTSEVVPSTYTELSTHHDGCTAGTRFGPACNAAMHRFCASRGFVSGFGPLENSGDTAIVGCVR